MEKWGRTGLYILQRWRGGNNYPAESGLNCSAYKWVAFPYSRTGCGIPLTYKRTANGVSSYTSLIIYDVSNRAPANCLKRMGCRYQPNVSYIGR